MNALQAEIIAALKTQPTIDPAKEIRQSVDFMKAYLKKNTFLKSYVLGISGGQDSTLVGALAEKAMQEMRAETGDESYQFIAVRLPYGEQADESDAMAAIEFMAADQVKRVNIKGSVDAMVQSLAETGVIVSDFNKGNIKARVRMIAQYGVAGENSGAVLGTDHSAESITGFYTKFGDGGADLVPIFRLNKRQGKAMLAELGAPKHLYEKVPTADLEEDRPALPDELALGVTYDQIDDYLEGRQVSEEAATKIENWYKKTAHKRHLPITIYDTFWQ
ncbi:ammonia-dependent NAD(+) synthetase [Latilactobacillus sakei subsp. carnosus]|uniref:ammonia-dependent NAD(+) synthetase n=1 Tax=Latilactobacillus TaxID=2767885 RepID=UPI000C126252|nr:MULTISPECIES: ammonia-dependent NAD(+) synthetase [Latilactobacillus]MCM1571395.1 ammonia-dependent NAD(+) synthetase [Latilactobacillus sakei]MDV8938080.1 ammonia-dependent NAD(+) synthetase [Latilactobacillus sp.]MDV8939847.1 ammonia-dependent NAD(+) synthetase [Latilactobacillus sp.]MDV8941631.1 ammonia-dependent NAD(+) synthetase [Latilactobacillus sp.]MDV8943385.1 ammonia-dependent NAD(+) synthetase [Latilactobacillus sp.]